MKRMLVCAAVVALVAGAVPLPAGAGPGGPKGPKANPKASVKAGGPRAPKATGPKSPKSTGPAATTVKSGGPDGGTSKGKAAAPGQVKRGATTPALTGDAPEVGTTAVGPNVPRNPKLQARLQAMLPPGMTLEDAAAGFRNQGQFIAAVNVSNNLGIPFQDLKVQMVDQQSSLGQAIQTLKPQADATLEARRAETQARQDLDQ